MSIVPDGRIRFIAEPSAELPFTEDAPIPQPPAALALPRLPDPLEDLRAKVDQAELNARLLEAKVRLEFAKIAIAEVRAKAAEVAR